MPVQLAPNIDGWLRGLEHADQVARYLFATNPKVMSQVLTIVHRVISTFLIKRARMTVKSGAQSGAVSLGGPHYSTVWLRTKSKSSLPYALPERRLRCQGLLLARQTAYL